MSASAADPVRLAEPPLRVTLAAVLLAAQVECQRAELAITRQALAGAYRYAGYPVPQGLVPEPRRDRHGLRLIQGGAR